MVPEEVLVSRLDNLALVKGGGREISHRMEEAKVQIGEKLYPPTGSKELLSFIKQK